MGSHHKDMQHSSVIEIDCLQDEPFKEESKAASPERGLTFGELEAAELVNGNADLAVHDQTDAFVFEVANGNQEQIKDVADQIVDDEAEEAADVDQRVEEDRNSEEKNGQAIDSESESAQEVVNDEDYQYYESQVVQILYDQK